MANTDDKPLKITLEDLERVSVQQEPQPVTGAAAAPGVARHYGNIAAQTSTPEFAEAEKGSIFLQGWFYLGIAGMLGALLGWGIAEPGFVDGGGPTWGRMVMIPFVVAFLCLGCGIAESIVERSFRKALTRGLLCIALGLVFGFMFDFVANVIFRIGLQICFSLGVRTNHNPAIWITRGFAWMVFGAVAGLVYGLVDQSARKGRYGALGAVIGAGLGGMVFDPISFLTVTGSLSRAVGFGLFGLATGAAMGIVESALKDRWLYVAAGPLAGKQFILYKPITVIGSSQQCDIYLFKDTSVLPQHGSIEMRGAQTMLHALGPIQISGQPAKNRVLTSGDLIQIGRYAFHFRERHRN